MVRHVEVLKAALTPLPDPLIAYAVKANPNAAVLATLARQGLGADIVSGGEYRRAREAGIAAERIVFSGVGKTEAEMALALEGGLAQFNLESAGRGGDAVAGGDGAGSARAGRLPRQSRRRRRAPTPRSAPAPPRTSSASRSPTPSPPMSGSAGFPASRSRASPSISAASSPTSAPLEAAFTKVGALIESLRAAGHAIKVADLGGGLGVPYDPDLPPPPSPEEYGAMVRRIAGGWDARLVFEPGRLLVGNAGILLTRVIRMKPGAAHPFLIVDAAMNDLMRPALYDAWHAIEAVAPRGGRMIANVVGPVCEIRRHLRHGAADGRSRGRRPRPVPHRRRLCRRHVQHL